MGLTTTGTLVFLVACQVLVAFPLPQLLRPILATCPLTVPAQMFDCREAAATLVDLIVSDFDSYARCTMLRLTLMPLNCLLLQFGAVEQSMAGAALPAAGTGLNCPFPHFLNMGLLLQRVPEGQLAAHPAPQSRMGHVPALEVSRCAPPTDTVLRVDILPEKRCVLCQLMCVWTDC